MEQDGFRWTQVACGAVLVACGKAGRLNDAVQLIDNMRNHRVSPDGRTYLTLIQQCVRNSASTHAGDSRGGSKRALELLQLMKDAGPVPNIRHFTAAIMVCVAERNGISAITIFRMMQHEGIRPDLQSWGALLHAIGRAGQLAEMMACYREMCATGGVQPNLVIMTTLLDNAGKAGEVSIAEGIWSEMRDRQLAPDVKTYNALITCYATAKQPDKVEGVLAERIRSAAVKPDAIMFTRACADFRTVLSTMRPALLLVRPPCMVSLMQAYINNKRLDEAERVIGRMRAAGVEPILGTWRSIIHAGDELGDIKKVDLLYCDALSSKAISPYRPERSRSIKDSAGNTMPLGSVMDLHGLNGATSQAAIRHELRVRRKAAGSLRCGKPLYIITGRGGGFLIAAASDTLKSQVIKHDLHAAQPGIICCAF
ncbi:hypothetical protein JKP88DRAFT_317251 [Tribonema minus]|uniref:PROP1-like PPR domain-containing protein n=1 Tax=Tribonema minus TaxID=303371 RepID=A0A836CEM5_9STRA|nr:hypothetical protein JKP88DRAFT_317251 [Tribonema minus]